MHQLDENLIGLDEIVNNNYNVLFNKYQVLISDQNSNTIYKTPRSSDGLWRMPITDLSIFKPTSINNSIFSHSGKIFHNSNTNIRNMVWNYHYRMGHPSSETMCNAITGDTPAIINSNLLASDIRNIFAHEHCINCILSKKNLPSPHIHNKQTNQASYKESKKTYQPGEYISTDPSGEINPLSLDKDNIFYLFTCKATGYLWAIPSNSKTSEAFLEALTIVNNFIITNNFKIKFLQTDSENNLNSKLIDDYLSLKQIQHIISAPNQHYQNLVERHMQIIIKGTSTLLHSALFCQADLWKYALIHFCNLRNKLPNIKTDNKSPLQLFTSQQTNLNTEHKFIFGDIIAYGLQKHEQTFKFDIKNNIALYLTDHNANSSIIYLPDTHKCIIRADIFKLNISELSYLSWFKKRSNLINKQATPYKTNSNAIINFLNDSIIEIDEQQLQNEIITSIPLQPINNNINNETIPSSTILPLVNSIITTSHNNITSLTDKIQNKLHHTNSSKTKTQTDQLRRINDQTKTDQLRRINDQTQTDPLRRTYDHPDQLRRINDHPDQPRRINDHPDQLRRINDQKHPDQNDQKQNDQNDQKQNKQINQNITYNNYLHENHMDDTNTLQSTLVFSNINISDLTKSFKIFSNSENKYSPTQNTFFNDPPTLTTKCYKSNIKKLPIKETSTPTISKALKSINKDKWIEAIKTEITSILDHKILIPISYNLLPLEFEYIDMTTKLKLKFKSSGEIDKFKARSCGRGDQLGEILTTLQTFSPTISDETFLLLMQLSIIYSWYSFNIDTISAFLHQQRPPDAVKIYTRIDAKICEVCQLDPKQFYIIDKYIYGLPDSGKAYYEAIAKLLLEHHFIQSIVDNCLFYMLNELYQIYIIIYVDDTYIFSTKEEGIVFTKSVFQSQFPIQDSDPSNYLGLHIKKTTINNIPSYHITQPKLLQEIINEFLPTTTTIIKKRKYIPLNQLPNYATLSIENNDSITHINNNIKTIETTTYAQYMHLIGKLQYLVKSRPDIKLAISYLATKSNTHTNANYNDLLNIVNYLSSTKDLGLVLHQYCGNPLTIYCYVDASYLLHNDSKSHTGYTISFGPTGSFISKSKKQNLISTSSMHSEARAVYALIHTLINIYVILIELKLPIQLPIIVFEDNEALIYSTSNITAKNKKCRHFIMLVNFIKEQVQHGLIKFYKVPTEHNTADLLAKPTFGPDFITKRKNLGVF